ncbi:MAG: DNA replication and repair protein RecF [Lysobacteraceae bacterium]|nr:MAG: DNA replication and repair protein RecF [Xanthomonadaceae bacterium]
MRLRRLTIEHLRCIDRLELKVGPGIHWLSGPNGSGKSSVLEGLCLLASGRSFRAGGVDACVQRGAEALTVFAELETGAGTQHRLGLRRPRGGGFEARLDGKEVAGLGSLARRFPVVVVPADSGQLIAGPAEVRRRFLDWGLFHVEQDFHDVWRRYVRALRQRNALLREGGQERLEPAWRAELVRHGEALDRYRRAYVEALLPHLVVMCGWLLPGLGQPRLLYRPGYPDEAGDLAEALRAGLERDRRLGHTTLGPHRAGWSLVFPTLSSREMYSRGQAKLAAMAMALAQVAHYTAASGEPPVLALDDALAELDGEHQRRLVDHLAAAGAQCFLATADAGAVRRLAGSGASVFHVEQGRLRGPL